MLDRSPVLWIFSSFIVLFIGVGIYAGFQKQDTTEDYLLAGRGVNPWLAALSAVATGNSGFMFIGLIGFTYTIGLAAIWLSIGYVLGDTLAWLVVHKRLRRDSEATNSETFAAFLGHGIEGGRWITAIAALFTLCFLGVYAAAQLQAGSKALSVLFGWDISIGIGLGAAIVAIYAISGGIRASIWVGSIQSILMIGSMVLLAGVAIANVGNISDFWGTLNTIDPNLTSLVPTGLKFGAVPFILAWMVSGFGVVGQPHIMIRMMAIDGVEQVDKARNLYLALNAVLSLTATIVGLGARILLPELATGDTELALPVLAEAVLPMGLVGLVLVGLFSATISTAEGQLLACSAALTQDLFPSAAKSYLWAKVGTVVMVVVILGLALVSPSDVFVLVTFAWAALAASLGSLLLVRVLGRSLSTTTALAMMIIGVATALFWRMGLHWSDDLYEVLPGMAASLLTYAVIQPILNRKDGNQASGISSQALEVKHKEQSEF
ncbi:MAG: sodium/proline symporter [Cyanobacteria bacterium J06635_15]